MAPKKEYELLAYCILNIVRINAETCLENVHFSQTIKNTRFFYCQYKAINRILENGNNSKIVQLIKIKIANDTLKRHMHFLDNYMQVCEENKRYPYICEIRDRTTNMQILIYGKMHFKSDRKTYLLAAVIYMV